MSSDSPFDAAALREIYEGDALLFSEIMDILQVRLPLDLREMHQALVQGDGAAAAAVAHRMKSSLVSAAALPTSEVAAEIEKSALEGDLTQSLSRFSCLTFEIDAILAYYKSDEWECLFR
jgi:HPt (histidine-containing phosphotransfer) domain-containing protein